MCEREVFSEFLRTVFSLPVTREIQLRDEAKKYPLLIRLKLSVDPVIANVNRRRFVFEAISISKKEVRDL